MGNSGFKANNLFHWVVFGIACIVILLLFFAIWLLRSPEILNPFPKYPNSFDINQSLASGSDSLLYVSCSGLSFSGEKYKIFATKDNPNSIMASYRREANNRSLFEYKGSTSSGYNNQGTVSCFLGSPTNDKVPINVIVLFDPNSTEQAKIISNLFPTAPSNTTIIIALQGLAHYSE